MAITCVMASFSGLRVSSRPSLGGFSGAVSGTRLTAAPRPSVAAASSKMTIQAKQNSLKREKTAERNRMYNKSRKSEITTRMKKVFVALEGFKASPPASEADLAPVQVLINEAFQVIDKAVVKGILHRNTAARRKARLSKARQIVLVESGLYKP